MIRNEGFFYKSLTAKVTEYLKNQIYLGNYKGGERIIVNSVSKKLNISEEPVRNALKKLENNGLIEKIPRKGSFVVEFAKEDMEEIFEIRMLLENRVIDILIDEDKLSENDFDNLNNIINNMADIAAQNIDEEEKILQVNKKDTEFHKYLWNKSGSQRTVKILKNLYDQLQLSMIMDAKLEGSLLESAEKHYQIIESLKNKDKDKTKLAISNHIVTYKNQLKRKEKVKV